MPAKAKATKEMIIDAAFEIAKEMGAEKETFSSLFSVKNKSLPENHLL